MPYNRETDRHVYEAVYAASVKNMGRNTPQNNMGGKVGV